MSDLITRLSAELDRREAIARAATPGEWSVSDPNYPEAIVSGGDCVVSGGRWGGEASVFDRSEDAHHIAANDPAAVLRMCQAHRKLLDAYVEADAWYLKNRSAPAGELYGLLTAARFLAEGYGLTTEEGT